MTSNKTRITALAILFVMAMPMPLADAQTNQAYTYFGDGNLPPGCTTDSKQVGGSFGSIPEFQDGCYHMRGDLNYLDTPIIDVLLVPPVTPYPERDLRMMRQSIEMWEAGIDYNARQMGLDWLADGTDFHIFVDDDTVDTGPTWDPEIVVVVSNPAGGAGIGIDPFGLPGPCKGADPLATFADWAGLPGFNQHHDGEHGTYVESCEGGGTTCYAINGAIEVIPDSLNLFDLYDLVSHEVGHCLSVGHVGDALDHEAVTVPYADIMSYTEQSQRKCVSSLDVESFATRMSEFLLSSPLAANHGEFQIQHPDDHFYASSTGLAKDCPQPDSGILPGDVVDFYPGGDPTPDDRDGDGVSDADDNCPDASNASQADVDGDGLGDACDAQDNRDSDGDGVENWADQCPGSNDALDLDGDGTPDGCDSQDNRDSDGDGVENWADQCPGHDDAADADGDGIPDGCDPIFGSDSDGDGVQDSEDQCEGFDDGLDMDGDGIPNHCDPDTDGDGQPNNGKNKDADDDNDGVSDRQEQRNGTDPLDPASN